MSDMYLELRSKIAVVAQKTYLGTARRPEAQDAVVLSNEAIARRIPCSEKTWRRYKQSGYVPTALLPTVAKVLNLDLVEAGQRSEADTDEIRSLATQVSGMQEQLDRIERLLRPGDPPSDEDSVEDFPR